MLPDYLIPSALVTLDALPVTANRKLDRAALPAPAYAADSPRAPRSPQEQILCRIFGEVLNVENVGTEASFFDLGGHSLLATRLIGRIRAELGADLPLRAVFEAPTVAGLARLLESAERARPPLRGLTRPDPLPLSPAQERLWFLHRIEGAAATYNVPVAISLTGSLQLAALRDAIGDVTDRHEVLRTTFPQRDGDPCQLIAPPGANRPVLHLAQAQDGELPALLAQAARYRFDLTAERPLRATVFRIGAQSHVLLLVIHHIAMDGGSAAPLARDLSSAYSARLAGASQARQLLPPLPLQYADYAVWQRGLLDEDGPDAAMARQLEYWKSELAGLPALATLPGDYPRPVRPSFEGGSVGLRIEGDLHRRIADLAIAAGGTVFMVLQAALAALVTRMGAGTDVPIGTPAGGRAQAELDDLIGPFINTLVLRTDASGNPSFAELLRRVRETDLRAYANSDVPFERVVESVNPDRSLSHHPLFQIMLVLQNNAADVPALAGLRTEPVPVEVGVAKFDLCVNLGEERAAAPGASGLVGEIQYAVDLFDRRTACDLAARLVCLLESAIADPGVPIGRLAITSADERSRLLEAGRGEAHPVPADTLAGLFEAQVARTPSAPAVIFGARRLSFAGLNERANRLARRLSSLGAGPRVPVAILLDRSELVVVASLACAKAGAAYVPLEP